MTPRLKQIYDAKIKADLTKQFGYTNPMQVPKLAKIVVNMGLGKAAVADNKVIGTAVAELQAISGQKVVVTKARKSIANFKLREGVAIGCKVTLRGARMYEFLDRLVTIALPRVRDFRGVSRKSFDGRGNFAIGLKEQIIFPEIDFDKVDKVRGMDIVICTTARSNDEGQALLAGFSIPFAS